MCWCGVVCPYQTLEDHMSTIVRKARLDAAAAQVGKAMHSARTTQTHSYVIHTERGAGGKVRGCQVEGAAGAAW